MSAGTATVERIARKAIARVISHPIRNKTEFNEVREEWHALMDLPSPQAVVRFMAEQRGLDQGELAELLGGRSRLSEFLNEKRELSRTQIKMLREKLGIPADLLIA